MRCSLSFIYLKGDEVAIAQVCFYSVSTDERDLRRFGVDTIRCGEADPLTHDGPVKDGGRERRLLMKMELGEKP